MLCRESPNIEINIDSIITFINLNTLENLKSDSSDHGVD